MQFIDYRNDSAPLYDTVVLRADELGVKIRDWLAIDAMLAPLGAKPKGGVYHHDHSLRVGLLASEIATGLNSMSDVENYTPPKPLFFAGLLHDVGKALVPACTLCATEKWTDEDKRNMEPHVMDGFRMLRDRFDFTAHVIIWHHRFQSGGYPIELPGALQPFSEATLRQAREYGKILMVADVFDAMHRVNSATAGKPLSPTEIKRRMMLLQPDLLGDLVERLYDKGVLR